MDFYTDSICDKPDKMLNPDNPKRSQDENQKKLGVSDLAHRENVEDVDMDEFSQLLARVPSKVLYNELMTHQQRLLAKSLWEACNYGGRPKPGDFKNMEDKRLYWEWVLRMDHRQQRDKAAKKR